MPGIRAVCLTFVILMNGGCVAIVCGGAAGAAGYAYAKGAKERIYAQPVEVTTQAAEHALADMGIQPYQRKADKLGAVFKAETATGKKLHIHIERKGDASEVSIRAGAFGDEELANALFAKIQDRLPEPALQPAGFTTPAARSD